MRAFLTEMTSTVWTPKRAFSYGYYEMSGYAVAQLVEALRYKPEGRGFDSRWCHWYFSLT